MSELAKKIEAEDARINAAAKERLIAAMRILEAEIKWIEFPGRGPEKRGEKEG